jgi:Alr-MurF fusion protein
MYSVEHIREMVKGKWLQQAAPATIEHLLLDSRKVAYPNSSLFFAIEGARRDGHLFLQEAYDKGVRSFIVSDEKAAVLPPDASILLVNDTLLALQQIASHHRKQFAIPVIGITGSNGKTVVKEWLNQLLEAQFSIVRSPKSYNSQIGVPLSVWQMNSHHELAIFEAGISQSGEMEKLERIIQPSIGIFTNIGEAHSDGFLNQRQKVKEKLQLFRHVKTLIYSSDYPEINEGVADLVQRLRNTPDDKLHLFTWGSKTDATLKINSLLKDDQCTYIGAIYNNEDISIKIPFTDDGSVENAISCWCTLLHLGLDYRQVEKKMLQLQPLAMRLELKKGINNCSIINDSYSADISSLTIALDFLSQQQQHQRKTVILSDILHSGKSETSLYETVAAALQQKKINRLIGIGPQLIRYKTIFEKTTGLETRFYESVEGFRKDFFQLSFQNETILLKGARLFAFENIMPLLEQKVHQTVLEINLTALLYNVQQYQHILMPSTKLMAMVKAFSYGSGSYEIANLLQFQKVDYLAVAYADEGVELRKGGISLPIMVMNPEIASFEALVQYQLEPDIYSFKLLHSFDEYLKKQDLNQFPIHIELETGMNRLGFDTGDVLLLAEKLKNSNCKIQTVFSHLAGSEDPNQKEFTILQAEKFKATCEVLKKELARTFIMHIANSAAIVNYPELQLDMVRLGIGLHGIEGSANHRMDLKEVATLRTTIAQIKHLNKGETVGYGRKAMLKQNKTIATVRLGYADGYPRRLGNGRGKMWVNGQLAPVIGTVCMDMTMLDISGILGVEEGDEVIVFGKNIAVEEVAKWADTIPYEIMTGISQRVKRVYYQE